MVFAAGARCPRVLAETCAIFWLSVSQCLSVSQFLSVSLSLSQSLSLQVSQSLSSSVSQSLSLSVSQSLSLSVSIKLFGVARWGHSLETPNAIRFPRPHSCIRRLVFCISDEI